MNPASRLLIGLIAAMAGAAFSLLAALPANAAEVVVRVQGLAEPLGRVGCSLFSGAPGFPMDNARARAVWLPARADGVTCRFDNVVEGLHAVSIGHDLNANDKVDTNFVGLPTEQWGVSNNARPLMRAPRFEEAAFRVAGDAQVLTIDIKVAK